MLKPAAWAALPGTTPEEKFAHLGLVIGTPADIRKLGRIADNYGIPIYLFFEDDLARNRDLHAVLNEYATVPEYERPVILVESFLQFTQENDPSFEQTMEEFPLMVTVIKTGSDLPGHGPSPSPYVTCLMPFLDELDLVSEAPQPGQIQPLPPS
jgi:transcriptional regulator with XRE-family HTH domain